MTQTYRSSKIIPALIQPRFKDQTLWLRPDAATPGLGRTRVAFIEGRTPPPAQIPAELVVRESTRIYRH